MSFLKCLSRAAMALGSGLQPEGSGVVDMVLLPRGLSVGAELGACHVLGCGADIMHRGMKGGLGGCLLALQAWWYLPDGDAVVLEVFAAIHVVRRVGSEPAIDA